MKYLIFGLLLMSTTLFAQNDKKAQDILNKISADVKALNSFYIEFNMDISNPATGEKSNDKGTGFVKGNKYYTSFGKNTLICNGLKVWTVVKDEKVTYQADVDSNDDALTPKKIMTIWESGFKSKYEKETTIDGKKVHQISLFPIKPGEVNYHTITLYVTSDSNELYQGILKTKDGGIMKYTITKLEKNKAVEDAKFVYNPQNFPGYQLVKD
ncbi:MAG: outer membrane lipoprotein carrier protein LolA [Brumimicrobium sp.]|nr:outer membrane lipoprotein carrier protein LolA [Brumimicrobium sp.]